MKSKDRLIPDLVNGTGTKSGEGVFILRTLHSERNRSQSSWNVAAVRQPRGLVNQYDTIVGYVLGDRAYLAGEIEMQQIEIIMGQAEYKTVTPKTIRNWRRVHRDLPERLADEGTLSLGAIPEPFRKYLRSAPRWVVQQQSIPAASDSSLVNLVRASIIIWGAYQGLKLISSNARTRDSHRSSFRRPITGLFHRKRVR